VLSALPSVFFQALGKEALCRVPKKNNRKKILGKEVSLPNVEKHSV
jgi:hypothetical protein